MIWQVMALIMTGLTCIAEVYIARYENLKYLHGMHFFVDLLLMVGLPILSIVLLYIGFIRKKTADKVASEPEKKSEQFDIYQYNKIHISKLQMLIRENQSIEKQINTLIEQLKRFEKKYALAMELSSNRELNASRQYACHRSLKSSCEIVVARTIAFEDLCNIFDNEEYLRFISGDMHMGNDEIAKRKQKFFTDLIAGIEDIINKNEELILKIDELTKAVSDKTNNSSWDANALIALDELEAFVHQCERETDQDMAVNQKVASEWKKAYMSE